MRQFVDQDHLRTARKNAVNIHLLEDCSLVFNLFSGNALHIREEFFNAFSAVRFYDSDRHIFATASPAQRLTQHAECFPDTRSIPKAPPAHAASLLRRSCTFPPF